MATLSVPDVERQECWDARLLALARLVSTWSKDPSTKVGAAIVTPENVVVSVGYNGFAQSMPDAEEHYNDRAAKYSRIVHAETNAIVLARADVRGNTLYATFPPCDRCAVTIIQAGIVRVVCPIPPKTIEANGALDRWKAFQKDARQYFGESMVEFVEIDERA